MFANIHNILLPIFVPIITIFIIFIMHFIGKLPLKGDKTFLDRMQTFYTFTGANLLGKFLFFSLPDAIGPSVSQKSVFLSGLVFAGFFGMYVIFKLDRINHTNHNYLSPPTDTSMDIKHVLDRETMTIKEYISMNNLDNVQTSMDRFQMDDEKSILRRRSIISITTLGVLSLTCVLEGFFLIYKEAYAVGGSWSTFSFFLVDKIMETVTICTVMLYAMYHCKKYNYWVCATCWIIVAFCSTIPIMSGMTWQESYVIVNSLATNIFYAISAGCVFFLALYFIWIDKSRTNKKEIFIQILVFCASGTLSWMCGIFV
jgi:hypothetical protein